MAKQLSTPRGRGVPWSPHDNKIRTRRLKKIKSALLLFCENENLVEERKTLERLANSSFDCFSYTIQEQKQAILHLPVEKLEQEIQKKRGLFLKLVKEIHSRFGTQKLPATGYNIKEVVYDPKLNPFAKKSFTKQEDSDEQFSKKTKTESLIQCPKCQSDHFHIDIQDHKIFCVICNTIYD